MLLRKQTASSLASYQGPFGMCVVTCLALSANAFASFAYAAEEAAQKFELVIDASPTNLSVREPLYVAVVIHNTGEKAIELYTPQYYLELAVSHNRGPFRKVRMAWNGVRAKTSPHVIGPHSCARWLCAAFTRHEKDQREKIAFLFEKPGKYAIEASLRGGITSNSIELTVKDEDNLAVATECARLHLPWNLNLLFHHSSQESPEIIEFLKKGPPVAFADYAHCFMAYATFNKNDPHFNEFHATEGANPPKDEPLHWEWVLKLQKLVKLMSDEVYKRNVMHAEAVSRNSKFARAYAVARLVESTGLARMTNAEVRDLLQELSENDSALQWVSGQQEPFRLDWIRILHFAPRFFEDDLLDRKVTWPASTLETWCHDMQAASGVSLSCMDADLGKEEENACEMNISLRDAMIRISKTHSCTWKATGNGYQAVKDNVSSMPEFCNGN